jgi:ATP-dependent metalloprotease
LVQATQLAEAMITRYGMSKRLGHVVYERNSESPETRALIEHEMKALLDRAYEDAKSLLLSRESELHRVAAALLERETLSGEEVKLAAIGRLPPLPAIVDVKAQPSAAAPESISETGVLDAPTAADST